jgi:hypothetical protein
MSGRRTTLGERMSAVEACIRVLRGAERAPSRAMEREYLADCLAGAMTSLRWLEANGEDARAYVELRRRAREAWAGEAVADVEPVADRAATPCAYPQARRAAMRCAEGAFQKFLGVDTPEGAADALRRRCEIASRKDLDRDASARERWRALDVEFGAWLRCADGDGDERG